MRRHGLRQLPGVVAEHEDHRDRDGRQVDIDTSPHHGGGEGAQAGPREDLAVEERDDLTARNGVVALSGFFVDRAVVGRGEGRARLNATLLLEDIEHRAQVNGSLGEHNFWRGLG